MPDPLGSIQREEWIIETRHFFVVTDAYPVARGHLLVVSKEAHTDYCDLPNDAKADLTKAVDLAIRHLDEKFDPDGFNIGMNCGAAAGQTVFRFHCHVIPRYQGDVEDPRGGVRHAVMGKGYY